jgi:hypothetical protein
MNLLDLAEAVVQPHQVVWANQNGPRPKKPYFRLNVRSRAGAPPVIGDSDADGHFLVSEMVLLRVELECFGQSAFAKASAAASRLRFPSVSYLAQALGVGVGPVEGVRDMTALLNDSQYEERALLEFSAYVTASDLDNLGLIEHVLLNCPEGHTHIITSPNAPQRSNDSPAFYSIDAVSGVSEAE